MGETMTERGRVYAAAAGTGWSISTSPDDDDRTNFTKDGFRLTVLWNGELAEELVYYRAFEWFACVSIQRPYVPGGNLEHVIIAALGLVHTENRMAYLRDQAVPVETVEPEPDPDTHSGPAALVAAAGKVFDPDVPLSAEATAADALLAEMWTSYLDHRRANGDPLTPENVRAMRHLADVAWSEFE